MLNNILYIGLAYSVSNIQYTMYRILNYTIVYIVQKEDCVISYEIHTLASLDATISFFLLFRQR